jgi:tyrosyl-tRNA synthetase
MTSPYAFYQFWVNVQDEDVGRFLRWFSLRNETEIRDLENEVGSGARVAQKALALELTEAVHGRDEAETARKASEALFSGNIVGLPAATLLQMAGDVPSIPVPREELAAKPLSVVQLLLDTKLCKSKSDARRKIGENAVRINGKPCSAGEGGADPVVGPGDFLEGKVLILQRGKQDKALVIVQPSSS